MKVLHINCNYMTSALHQTMIESLDFYVNNAVFCPVIHGGKNRIIANSNVKTIECFNQLDRVFYFVKQKKILKSVVKSFDPRQFDIIHAYTLLTDGNCAMELSDKYNVPFVVAVRNTDINDFFKYKPYLIPRAIRIMEKASVVFFLSDAYRDLVLNKYMSEKERKKLEEKIVVVPNGINNFWHDHRLTKDKENPKESDEHINIVYAGKLEKNKNIPMIQQAVRILAQKGKNVKFTVVGEVLDNRVYDKVINDENTIYLSAMPKEKLIDVYRKNDLFCMASIYETFGLVYAEAMSQGLPVLYTKGQGFDGQFEEGLVGYAIDCFDPIDIANKIELVIKNYPQLSGNCIRLSEKFDWNKIAKKYSEIYDSILTKQS